MTAELSDLNAVIDQHRHDFDKPGVLSIRPGYKVKGGWITDRPSVVVTVNHKVAHPPPAEMLPSEVAGVPVDVRQASLQKHMELEHPEEYAKQLRLTPDTGSVPHFPDEQTRAGVHPAALASAHARLSGIAKQELNYSVPPDVNLDPIEAQATVHLGASPDVGWAMLKGFLTATTTSLTVGLYDLTSAHIATVVENSLASKQLMLVLDHPAQNPSADQTDADTVEQLRKALGDGFIQAWALTKLDPDATAWIYPTAYHIKVAVRDHSAFWLSSGNWNNSNQPNIAPSPDNPADAQVARGCDRDWHVIVEQAQLAEVFESFIRNDLAIASAHNKPPEPAGEHLTPPPPAGSKLTAPFNEFFTAIEITGKIKITPLLTPDPGVYANAVRSLIASAKHSLYMQFQYIEPPKAVDATSQGFADLIDAVIDRQKNGVEVKIIMSEYETAGYLEQLQALGVDVVRNVRIQNNVHNKGIVVDGAAVLVSSQNWSTDGTLYNRDAGVILYDQRAAEYFQKVFLHDWTYLAKQRTNDD